MQRVANCLLHKDNQLLMLKKPRRGWWVAPGGKMEPGESVKDTVIREFREETGLFLKKPLLRGVFTFIIKEADTVVFEWMMFTFSAGDYEGEAVSESEEGKVAWVDADQLPELPMAEGDHHLLNHVLHGNGMLFGTFTYTSDYQLLAYRLDPEPEN
ncbi:MAG TPA: 8-oxo-dGTP diphosphatase [Bacillales bacterium]|nr:8-oxo-dGTP diphosphatase [Bacillales bacterium]